MTTIRVQPSILAANPLALGAEVQRLIGADEIHVDVMDGTFVPNLAFGFDVTKRLREASSIPLDVHLMVADPGYWAPRFASLGAFSTTFHIEAVADAAVARGIVQDIHAEGSRASIAIKPDTPLDGLLDVLDAVDQVLIMTVEPGFGGQSFRADQLPRIRQVRDSLDELRSDAWLQVDGGIGESNISAASEAGANAFVAGSSVFAGEPSVAIELLRELARIGTRDPHLPAGGN